MSRPSLGATIGFYVLFAIVIGVMVYIIWPK